MTRLRITARTLDARDVATSGTFSGTQEAVAGCLLVGALFRLLPWKTAGGERVPGGEVDPASLHVLWEAT